MNEEKKEEDFVQNQNMQPSHQNIDKVEQGRDEVAELGEEAYHNDRSLGEISSQNIMEYEEFDQ